MFPSSRCHKSAAVTEGLKNSKYQVSSALRPQLFPWGRGLLCGRRCTERRAEPCKEARRKGRIRGGRAKRGRRPVTPVPDWYCSCGSREPLAEGLSEQGCFPDMSKKPYLCYRKVTRSCPRRKVLLWDGASGEHHPLLGAGPAGKTLSAAAGLPSRGAASLRSSHGYITKLYKLFFFLIDLAMSNKN